MFTASLSQLFIATFYLFVIARTESLDIQGSSYGLNQLVSALFWLREVVVHYNSLLGM